MATRSRKAVAAPEHDEAVLLSRIKVLESQLHALKVEREFWVEQARGLQNHLQTVMRGQAAMLEQMANTSLTADDVRANCAQLSQELRQPLTTVEAISALASSVKGDTQGGYTPRFQYAQSHVLERVK